MYKSFLLLYSFKSSSHQRQVMAWVTASHVIIIIIG